MVNPMRNNWWEMIDAVEFCNNYNVNLWYNTIRYPEHLSLWNVDKKQLEYIYNTMKDQLDMLNKSSKNYSKYYHLVEKQIKSWLLTESF